jgi:mono/diheme cytochrome c family protein
LKFINSEQSHTVERQVLSIWSLLLANSQSPKANGQKFKTGAIRMRFHQKTRTMKSKLNLWKIAVTLFALIVFSFGCTDSDSQQSGNESTSDTTGISPSTSAAAVPSDSETMPSAEAEDAQVVADETSQTPAAESARPSTGTTQTTGKNAAQTKMDNKNPKPGTTAPPSTSSQEKTPIPAVEKPTAPAAQPKTPESKPEPKVTPAAPPAEKPAPKEPAPPVQPAPKPEETPAPPAKTEVPKPAPATTSGSAKDWPVPEKDKNMANPVKTDKGSLSLGKSLYRKHCASCHGKTGLGDGPKAAQLDTPSGDFTAASFQQQTDGSLYYKTVKGRDDMPSYKKKIPDPEDVWSIINYIRTFK